MCEEVREWEPEGLGDTRAGMHKAACSEATGSWWCWMEMPRPSMLRRLHDLWQGENPQPT